MSKRPTRTKGKETALPPLPQMPHVQPPGRLPEHPPHHAPSHEHPPPHHQSIAEEKAALLRPTLKERVKSFFFKEDLGIHGPKGPVPTKEEPKEEPRIPPPSPKKEEPKKEEPLPHHKPGLKKEEKKELPKEPAHKEAPRTEPRIPKKEELVTPTPKREEPRKEEKREEPRLEEKKGFFGKLFGKRGGKKEEKTRQQKTEKKGRRKLRRKSLAEYLEKAGYELNADAIKRNVFRIVLALFLVTTVVLLVIASRYGAHTGDVILFMIGLWTAVFAFALIIVWAAIFFFLDYRIYRRTRELEDVLPDFLQLASSNIAAGMPVDRALWYAIRPNFGVLAKEMEEVAKATMAGEDLETSLIHFANKYDSVTLKRSIDILIEGLHAGGEMADLLNKIALNIDEMKINKKEMAANVTTYAIFITFASIIIAPFLFALATELLSIIVRITGTLDLSSSGAMFTIKSPGTEVITNFKTFSVLTLTVTTLFSACIVSVIKRGRIMEGVKSIPVYVAVAIIIYLLSVSLLHTVLGGIV